MFNIFHSQFALILGVILVSVIFNQHEFAVAVPTFIGKAGALHAGLGALFGSHLGGQSSSSSGPEASGRTGRNYQTSGRES